MNKSITRAWMACIDKANYNIERYLEEAKVKGVSLAVDLDTLSEMRWNDMLCFFSVFQRSKALLFFAHCPLTIIGGLSSSVTKDVLGKFRSIPVEIGGKQINRKSGSYIQGVCFRVEAEIPAICNALREYEQARGKISHITIGCGPGVLNEAKRPYTMFPGLDPFDQVLPFNFDSAMSSMEFNGNSKRGIAKGQFLLTGALMPKNPRRVFVEAQNFNGNEGIPGGGIIETWIFNVS